MSRLIDFVLFQAAWFVAVAAAARGDVWLGVLAMSPVVVIHLVRVQDRVREAGYLFVAGAFGLVLDTLLSVLEVFSYPSSETSWTAWIVPPWIVALWVGFATLPRASLSWLDGRPALAALVGAVGGPLSFLGGMRLGAIAPGTQGATTWILLAAEYALATPLLVWLAPRQRADRDPTRTRRLVARVGAGLGALFVGLASITTGCAGMSKDEIETRLTSLSKNTIARGAGLQRRTMRVELDGQSQDVDYVWIRLPARSPSGRAGGPIVFVHGTPASLFNWSILLSSVEGRRLNETHDLYALDVVGHGLTRSKARSYTFQACADHVRGFLRMLDLRDVTLVGQSYGGEFAWRCALDERERVTRLALIDSSGYRRPDDGWLPEEHKLREWPGARFGYLLNSRERLRPALQLHFGVPLTDEQLDEMYFLCDNAENWRAMTQLCRDENGTREAEIAAISQPTLLLWGANDIAYGVDAYGRRFAQDIRGALLHVVSAAGHYPHEERPDDVAAAIRRFVEEPAARR